MSGCSIGGNSGQDVSQATSYRRVNFDCSFKASTSEFDVPLFRDVFHCLNARHGFNHALDPSEELIDNLTDEQLSPFVDLINQTLSHRNRIYQIQESYRLLKSTPAPGSSHPLIDDWISEFGKIVQNGEFISSGLALLQEGFLVNEKTLDPELLKVIEIFSRELSPLKISQGLRFALNISGSTAFKELVNNFKQGLVSDQRSRNSL